MCGIAGIISVRSQQVMASRLQQMIERLSHRGPDGQGCWVNATAAAGFAHKRLSIIDLSDHAAQPMHYLGRYTIVHNGEIYNYIELRKQLELRGYAFSSLSDTEVILAAYDCWKENCLQYFDGMFAFAIWDEKLQMLFAARDRLGEKPLFYGQQDGEFFFSSEIKALWAAGMKKEVNHTLLFNFITLGYTQNPSDAAETIYSGISKLPPASYFTCRPGQNHISPVRYWQVDPFLTNHSITAAEAIEQFAALLEQSVQKRLRSDVSLGTSLSGGLDSSAIAITIRRLQGSNRALQTFSAVFPGFKKDESRQIDLFIQQAGILNTSITPTADTLLQDFGQLCYHQEGLMASASVYAQYKVFELAARHQVKVLLDGQGADEILAGYHKYYHWYWQQLYRQDKALLRHELKAARQLHITEPWGWKNRLAAMAPAHASRFMAYAKKHQQEQAGHITRSYARAYGHSYYQLPVPDHLNRVLHYNVFCNGLEELLQYADRNSMAHGRELRLPFLQHELVEFIFSLPARFKINHGYTKWILRRAMEQVLPTAIVWQASKTGFEPPQRQWMQHAGIQELIQYAKHMLVQKGILEKQAEDKKIQPMDSHAADNFDWRYLVASSLF